MLRDPEKKIRLEEIRKKISDACQDSGREERSVTLVAVSKKKPWEDIADFASLGVRNFGENYVQEALAKQQALKAAGLADLRWHLIGTLQSNKAKLVPGNFTLFHALDSLTLASKLDQAAGNSGVIQNCLLEVNVDAENSKGGIAVPLVEKTMEELNRFQNVRILGLMCIPSPSPDSEMREPFARLRRIQEKLNREGIYRERLGELSMGMSSDFEDAIREGATIVRVGTALFGDRAGR